MLKLFRLIRPYRGYVAIVLVLALVQSIGFLLLPRLMSDIVDKGIVKGDQRAILQTGGLMPVGAMITSLQYAMQILFAVFMVPAMFVMLPRALASVARINEVLELAPEIVDPAQPTQPKLASTRGRVEFQNVTFQYPGAEEPALTGVSLRRIRARSPRSSAAPAPESRRWRD